MRAVKHVRCQGLMHAHDASTHTMGAIIRAAPLVVARRVAFPIGTAQIASKWKYARARHYIAVSEFVKSVLINGGVPAAMISVVYDGVPPTERETAAEEIIAI